MDTTYFHGDTVDISRGMAYGMYGTEKSVPLTPYSSRIKLTFPIRSRNIRAILTVPSGAEVNLKDEGTLFSLDNLLSLGDRRFVFQTRYFDLGSYVTSSGLDVSRMSDDLSIVKKSYTGDELCEQEICSTIERSKLGNTKDIFTRYKHLLRQIIGNGEINSVLDVLEVQAFVEQKFRSFEGEFGSKKTGRQILDELEQTGVYTGVCTEVEKLTRWLLSVGGVMNRSVWGGTSWESGTLHGRSYEGRGMRFHVWNEYQVQRGKVKYLIPLDKGNMPYPRTDSLLVHHIKTPLPQVTPIKGSEFASCKLLLHEVYV